MTNITTTSGASRLSGILSSLPTSRLQE